MLVQRISIAYDRALAAGESREDARRIAYLEVSAEFGGERLYIPGLPKAQRARQLAKLNKQNTLQAAAELGISRRRVQQLLKK